MLAAAGRKGGSLPMIGFRLGVATKTVAVILVAIGLYICGQFVLATLDANDRIDRCWDDTSPAYINDPQVRANEC